MAHYRPRTRNVCPALDGFHKFLWKQRDRIKNLMTKVEREVLDPAIQVRELHAAWDVDKALSAYKDYRGDVEVRR